MWLSRQKGQPGGGASAAEVGTVTIPGDPAAVYLNGERRQVPLYVPGGYHWRPAAGQELLVIKTGEEGELPCTVGCRAGKPPVSLESGEVAISAGKSSLVLRNEGKTEVNGGLAVAGTLTVNGETLESIVTRIVASMMK